MTTKNDNSVIHRKSLAEEVAEHLLRQIKDGQLREGDKLPIEPELMKMFGVGRSTVREAVKMLLNKGYVSVQQGRGTFVESLIPRDEPFEQRLRRADIQELYDVRQIFETAIAERAALRRSEQDLAEIRTCVEQRGEAALAGRLEACLEADINFHVAVAKATHNAILFELYRSATEYLQKGYADIYTDTAHFVKSQPIHEQLVAAIAVQNVPQAVEAASLFWNDVDMADQR